MQPRPRALRFFRCSCGHSPRFGAARCGKCGTPTVIYNRFVFWWFILLGLVFLGLALKLIL